MTGERTIAETVQGGATQASSPGVERSPWDELPRVGERIGRYALLERLGAGGMGVVYAAYDPQLDRKVAVKLLHGARDGSTSSGSGRNRLLDEARALAQLSHPNIIVVHDVGVHGGDVFVAMEFVDGRTLGQWLVEEKPSAEEICRVYAEAGQGLSAAHRAGLVHRDFKPDNVMIDADGRIKVLDFGLARPSDTTIEVASLPAGHVDDPKTVGLVGTPAYMAPEQFAGQRADARSDQFSFCVALYEALFGQRPFRGGTIAELAVSTLEDVVRIPAADVAIPSGVLDAVSRGLAKDPDERFDSMQQLLAALVPAEPRSRRPWWWIAASAVVGGALVATASAWWLDESRACAGASDAVAEVWNASRRADLQKAMARVAVAEARVADTLGEALDTYASEIMRQSKGACEANAAGTVDADEYDRWQRCLHRRRAALDHAVGFFVTTPESAQGRGLEVVAMLPAVAACDDPSTLSAAGDIDDPEQLARADALEMRLDEVSMHIMGGQREQPEAELAEILTEARKHDLRGIEARALYHRGLLEKNAGAPQDKRADLRRAFTLALESGYHEIAFESSNLLAHDYGYNEGELDEASFWLDVARALIARHGGTPGQRVHLKIGEGTLAYNRGQLESALQSYELAAKMCEQSFPNRPLRCSQPLTNLADTLRDLQRFDEAIEVYERMLDMQLDRYGEQHPKTAVILTNYAVALRGRGDLEEALAQAQRAVAIAERYFGHDNVELIALLGNVADTLKKLGRIDEAAETLDRVLALTEKHLGPDHLMMSYARDSRGSIALVRGDWASARADLEHALRIRERLYGQKHPSLVSVEHGLCETLLGLDEHEAARAHCDRVVQLCSEFPCAKKAVVAGASLVEAALAGGRREKAVQALEAAREALGGIDEPPDYLPARIELAEALVSIDRNSPDASADIARARQRLIEVEGEHDPAVRRLDRRDTER